MGNTMGSGTSQGTQTNLNEPPKMFSLIPALSGPTLALHIVWEEVWAFVSWLWVSTSPQGHLCPPSPAAEPHHPLMELGQEPTSGCSKKGFPHDVEHSISIPQGGNNLPVLPE